MKNILILIAIVLTGCQGQTVFTKSSRETTRETYQVVSSKDAGIVLEPKILSMTGNSCEWSAVIVNNTEHEVVVDFVIYCHQKSPNGKITKTLPTEKTMKAEPYKNSDIVKYTSMFDDNSNRYEVDSAITKVTFFN